MPIPWHLAPKIKGDTEVGQVRIVPMPSAAELAVAIAAANNSLAALVQQQAEAKEREEQEARDTAVGSVV